MNLPKPGQPVRGSITGKPVMVLLDFLGRRSCLRILWELRHTSLRFRALQTAADTNPAVLNARLGELKGACIVERTADGYQLTVKGSELTELILPLHRWAEKWAAPKGE